MESRFVPEDPINILIIVHDCDAFSRSFLSTVKTVSSPRLPLRYNFLVHSEKHSYFVGIGPICDVELTCKF